MGDFLDALREIEPSAMRESPKRPTLGRHRRGERKPALRAAVEWLLHPAVLARVGAQPAKGILLTGPPGSGEDAAGRAGRA